MRCGRPPWHRIFFSFFFFYRVSFFSSYRVCREGMVDTAWNMVLLGFTGFYRQVDGSYCRRHGFTGFYWVSSGFPYNGMSLTTLNTFLLGLTGFDWVSLGFPYKGMSSTTLNTFLLGFTGFYWVSLGFTGFYWVSLSFPYKGMSSTTLNTFLLGFTGFH